MTEERPIVFTVSKFSGVKFDCMIRTSDARAIEDSQTPCFSSSVFAVMGVLSEKYNNKGFAVLFEVD